MKIFTSLCIALLCLTACADKEELDGINYISARIQGKSWEDKEILKGTITSNGISCGGSNGEYTLGFLIPKDAITGTTTVTTGSASLEISANEVKQYTTSTAQLTLSNKTSDRVEGTFQMVLTNILTGETLQVTDGKFSTAY